MKPCPCGSGRPFEECCSPILEGALASNPEALMRSRYAAFTLGMLDHIERTHAPEVREAFNRAEAERTVSEVKWLGLEVRHASENGDSGSVEFAIRFTRDGQELMQHEIARFRRENGQWLYSGGQISAKPPPRHIVKIGRNDVYPCGSGKKYKKCCGT